MLPYSAKSQTDYISEGSATHYQTLKLALLSISALSGKSFLINDFIAELNLHVLLLLETWLDSSNETSTLIVSSIKLQFISESKRSHDLS